MSAKYRKIPSRTARGMYCSVESIMTERPMPMCDTIDGMRVSRATTTLQTNEPPCK